MSSKIKNLSEVLPKELQDGESRPLDDYMDAGLIIHNCREVQGKNGAYMRILVSEQPESEQFYIATGASQACEILRYLKENRSFPVQGKFVTAGRAILLKAV